MYAFADFTASAPIINLSGFAGLNVMQNVWHCTKRFARGLPIPTHAAKVAFPLVVVVHSHHACVQWHGSSCDEFVIRSPAAHFFFFVLCCNLPRRGRDVVLRVRDTNSSHLTCILYRVLFPNSSFRRVPCTIAFCHVPLHDAPFEPDFEERERERVRSCETQCIPYSSASMVRGAP
mgnify:CR=1 FL=1